jgi:hypothetical protein
MRFEIPKLHIVKEARPPAPELKFNTEEKRAEVLEDAGRRIVAFEATLQPEETAAPVPEPEATVSADIIPIQPEQSEEALMQMANLEEAYRRLREAA